MTPIDGARYAYEHGIDAVSTSAVDLPEAAAMATEGLVSALAEGGLGAIFTEEPGQ